MNSRRGHRTGDALKMSWVRRARAAENEIKRLREALQSERARASIEAERAPIPMILHCPVTGCGVRHIDEGELATRPHKTHTCQKCGFEWKPAAVPTVGVQFLPGSKNER